MATSQSAGAIAMNDSTQPRVLPPDELAAMLKMWREMRQWSQETLAEISGLNVRTVQRAEGGKAPFLLLGMGFEQPSAV